MSFQWSFPEIYKVNNMGIFVQLQMKINWKEVLGEYILMQIYICHTAVNKSLCNQQLSLAYFQI